MSTFIIAVGVRALYVGAMFVGRTLLAKQNELLAPLDGTPMKSTTSDDR